MKTYMPAAGRPHFGNTKPVVVVDDLSQMHGPSTGVVTLPVHLDWTPSSTYDLSVPARVRTLYATALREATSDEQLAEYLNADLLRRHWAELRLGPFVRKTWEQAHPELAWR